MLIRLEIETSRPQPCATSSPCWLHLLGKLSNHLHVTCEIFSQAMPNRRQRLQWSCHSCSYASLMWRIANCAHMHGLSGRCMVYTDPSCIQSLQSNYFTVQPITSHSTMHNVNSHLKSQHLRLHQVKRSSINFHQASAPFAVCNSRSRFLQIYNDSLIRVIPYISRSLIYFTIVLLLFRFYQEFKTFSVL